MMPEGQTNPTPSNRAVSPPVRKAPVKAYDRTRRVMAAVRWLLLGLVTLLAGYSVWTFWGPGSSARPSHGEQHYYCPMHPQIRSQDRGVCPICNMNLELIPEGRQAGAAPSAAGYHCPMHPQVRSPEPGTCPICSMKLEPIPPHEQQRAAAQTSADRYFCPMHPQVREKDKGQCPICSMKLEPIPADKQAGAAAETSTDRFHCPMHPQVREKEPGQCPICNMKLVPIPDVATETADAAARPHAPTEVVPVMLSTERQQLIGVTTTAATRGTLGQALRVPGAVEARESGLAQVRSRAAGFIERVAVRETGVRVSRGQPLVWIYSADIYRAQEEFLAASRWAAGTSTPRSAQSAGPSEMVAAARRALELLGLGEADIEAIARSGQALRAIPVRAPISGHVTRFNAILGSYASPETTLYEIADLSQVWVIASVHERDLSNVRPGMAAEFTSPGKPNEAVPARVELVEPEVLEATRTARVRLTVRNPKFELRPGQYGDVTFALPESSTVVIPKDAVIHTGEHAYVFVETSSGRFEPRIIRAGAQVADRVQIVDGLAEGERVVSRGSFMLDSESRLKASLAAGPAAAAPSGASAAQTELGPACAQAFDAQAYPEKLDQCRRCEREHAGMGSMVADCKNAIPRPWR